MLSLLLRVWFWDWIALLLGRLWPETRKRHCQKLFKTEEEPERYSEVATGVVMGGYAVRDH
jgi:hypothetical protein